MRLILILLFPLFASAQSKNTTTVIVKSTHTEAAQSILDAGFSIDKRDPELGTIVTSEKGFENHTWVLVIKARTRDSVTCITGEIKFIITPFGNGRQVFEPVVYRGMRGSPYRIAFSELEKIGRSLGQISYK